MKPYAILGRPEDLAKTPTQYASLLKRPASDQIPRILRIVTVDRETIYLYHLDTKRVYNPLTLQELSQPDV